jgi:trehalose 2-sulfotransferase
MSNNNTTTAPKSIFLSNFDYEIGSHERYIVDYFGEEKIFNQKQFLVEQDNIFICFTNRCGSNFLANVMESTGIFSEAGEYFNWQTIVNISKRKNILSFDDYCIDMIGKKTKNNLFVSKIGWEQLLMISKLGQIPNIFNNSKFIWIQRKDVLGQAISLSIANQTKKWTSKQTGNEIVPEYRKDSIQKIIKGLSNANLIFANYFNLFNADFIEIFYESFCENVEINIKKICDFTGKDFQVENLKEVKLEVQRNGINTEFREKFTSDIQEEFSLKVKL